MKRFKNWVAGIGISIAGLFGANQLRPPVMEAPEVVTVEAAATPAPNQGNKVPRLELGKVTGAIGNEPELIKQGIAYDNQIMADDCFKTEVLNAKFTNTKGLTNQQIYDVFASKVRTVGVEMFTGSWKQNHVYRTMGIDKGDGVVYLNRYFISTAYQIGDVSLHEGIGHQSGFSHRNSTEYTSVPYTLNSIFKKCAEKLGIKK